MGFAGFVTVLLPLLILHMLLCILETFKDIFLAVRRKKTTIFLSLKENAEVLEVKQMIEGILKVPPEDQVLLYGSTAMYDHKSLSYYGLTDLTARAHNPAVLGLCLRDSGKAFQIVLICSYTLVLARSFTSLCLRKKLFRLIFWSALLMWHRKRSV